MQDLYTELQDKTRQLDIAVKELRRSGTAYAEAERAYKVLLRTECLKMREAGMPIGMIEKVCYGIPAVADLRFKRTVAEAVYKANMESINSIKLQMRLIDAQIGREFSIGGLSHE